MIEPKSLVERMRGDIGLVGRLAEPLFSFMSSKGIHTLELTLNGPTGSIRIDARPETAPPVEVQIGRVSAP